MEFAHVSHSVLYRSMQLIASSVLFGENASKNEFYHFQLSQLLLNISCYLMCKFVVWLTVHRNSVWIRKTNWMSLLYSLFLF